MGVGKKLQVEIDRVLGKVEEGGDVFDDIWNKVYDTDNAGHQKEKLEADLKNEIKRLQRYRHQLIKAWIHSGDVNNEVSASYEQALMDVRELIVREMDRFKICEKETKRKSLSEEQQPKTVEIDQVLVKVEEGVDVFDDIWNKVYDTDNAGHQKETLEADLKKEIKRLQRYRHKLLKTWIQSSEVKNNDVSASYEHALMDARELIVHEMDRFKICEKETKTKSFFE